MANITTMLLLLLVFVFSRDIRAFSLSDRRLDSISLSESSIPRQHYPVVSTSANSRRDSWVRSLRGHRHNLSKRWYSIPYPYASQPNTGNPWPTLLEVNPSYDPDCPTAQERWVRYCFATLRDADTLLTVLLHAIARWEPAAQHSTLRIQPDLACNGDYQCICQEGATAEDALQITAGGDDRTETTMGYLVKPYLADPVTGEPWEAKGNAGYGDTSEDELGSGDDEAPSDASSSSGLGGPPYNWMVIGSTKGLVTNPQTEAEALVFWSVVADVVHELGHAIGFAHEHQRPDAVSGNNIEVNWANLVGYEELLNSPSLMEDVGFDPVLTAQERMDKICSDNDLAETYFPVAMAFMPDTSENDRTGSENYQYGSTYDYKSIMHYSSTSAARDKNAYTLVKHPSKVGEGESNAIWMGGSETKRQSAISVLDVVRVAQVYKLSDQEVQVAEAMVAAGGWQAIEVKIPGALATTVYPAGKGPPGNVGW